MCILGSDGKSYPYAEFLTIDNQCKFLEAKWGPVSPSYEMTPESITKAWITKWNKNQMSTTSFEQFMIKNKSDYDNILNKVTEAIKLGNTLGIV